MNSLPLEDSDHTPEKNINLPKGHQGPGVLHPSKGQHPALQVMPPAFSQHWATHNGILLECPRLFLCCGWHQLPPAASGISSIISACGQLTFPNYHQKSRLHTTVSPCALYLQGPLILPWTPSSVPGEAMRGTKS